MQPIISIKGGAEACHLRETWPGPRNTILIESQDCSKYAKRLVIRNFWIGSMHVIPQANNKQTRGQKEGCEMMFSISTLLSEFGSPFDVLSKVFLAHGSTGSTHHLLRSKHKKMSVGRRNNGHTFKKSRLLTTGHKRRSLKPYQTKRHASTSEASTCRRP